LGQVGGTQRPKQAWGINGHEPGKNLEEKTRGKTFLTGKGLRGIWEKMGAKKPVLKAQNGGGDILTDETKKDGGGEKAGIGG